MKPGGSQVLVEWKALLQVQFIITDNRNLNLLVKYYTDYIKNDKMFFFNKLLRGELLTI